MTDLLPNKAYQFTTKIDHHFNDNGRAERLLLRQVTHEANTNYNPVNKFVGAQLSARSRDQDLRAEQHLRDELARRC